MLSDESAFQTGPDVGGAEGGAVHSHDARLHRPPVDSDTPTPGVLQGSVNDSTPPINGGPVLSPQ